MYESQLNTYKDRKYRDDTAFQKISRKYLSLDENKIRTNNEHLKRVIENTLITLMKEEDPLFEDIFRRIMYGGSFYKKTKFGNPEEFDLDFIFKLPVNYDYITIDTDHDNYGYIKIQINEPYHQNPKWKTHERTLTSWLIDDNYLNQNKFRRWFESVFIKSFSKLSAKLRYVYNINYIVKQKKSGPAFTLLIEVDGAVIDVDLVPCLEFDKILTGGYKNFSGRKYWYAIPKPLYSNVDENVLWRLCFYEHEKDFLDGNLKDVIRMLKKFRNSMGWDPIASYFIETIFYNQLQYHKDKDTVNEFLRSSKTGLFMQGLQCLLISLESNYLPYFWHPGHNLLKNIKASGLENFKNRLRRVINIIDAEIVTDKYAIAKFVLKRDEYIDGMVVPESSFYDHDDVYEPEARPAPQTADAGWCSIL